MDRRNFLKTSGVAAGAATLGFGVSAQQAMQDVSAQSVPDEGVELLTDEYGVSHVYGATLYDVGYGQGYAQARDRLFQMDLLRMIGRGESAAAVGPSQVSSDLEVKRDLYNEAELQEQWETASDEITEAIRGYTDGVNDRMDELKSRGELPGEFTLLGRQPDDWKPTDSVAVITFTIGMFGVNGGAELGNAKTITEMFDHVTGVDSDMPDAFESEAAAWAAYHDCNKVVVPEDHYGSLLEDEVAATDERALAYDEVPQSQLDAIEAARDTEAWGIDESSGFATLSTAREPQGMLQNLKFGSHGVIVDGEHTETGDAMLCGGPQMSLLKPPVIHEVGLHGPEYDVVGVGVVGTPSIVIGNTPNFGWTVTTSGDDAVDTIAVELDPDDRYRYKWDGEWHEFVIEEYTHEPNAWGGIVEGSMAPERIEQEVAYVEQEGTKMPVVAHNPDENMAFVKRVATRMEELDGAFQWAELGRASSREAVEDALAEFPFGFNFLYIDDETIAQYRTGKLPDREPGADPRFPVPVEYHGWNGFTLGTDIDGGEVDPERGFVVNWNNAPAAGWRNEDSEFGWDGTFRAEIMDRLTKEYIVDTDDDLSAEDFDGLELPDEASGNLTIDHVADIIEFCSTDHPFAPHIMPHFVAAARATDDDRLNAMADEIEVWADAENLERFTEADDFTRWYETRYSFKPGDDGRYPSGGMAIYEEIAHELIALMFDDTLGDEAPSLVFNPRAGSGTSGSVDPHAADHGSNGGPDSIIVDALEGRTTFDWLADYDGTFALRNVATGETLDLDTASGLWGWLFGEDEIRRADPDADDAQLTYWRADGAETDRRQLDGVSCELTAAESNHAVTLSDHSSGGTLEPSTEEATTLTFTAAEDGTYYIETAAGQVLQPEADGSGVCQRPRDGSSAQRWAVSFAVQSEQPAVLRTVMENAADRLEEQFDSSDPSDWRLEHRKSEFSPLGAASVDTIAMSNRSSYQQLIAIGQGEGAENHFAKSCLPPSNTGHLDTWELIATQLGNEPDRLTDQLDLYANFEFKPHPIARETIEERAIEEQSRN